MKKNKISNEDKKQLKLLLSGRFKRQINALGLNFDTAFRKLEQAGRIINLNNNKYTINQVSSMINNKNGKNEIKKIYNKILKWYINRARQNTAKLLSNNKINKIVTNIEYINKKTNYASELKKKKFISLKNLNIIQEAYMDGHKNIYEVKTTDYGYYLLNKKTSGKELQKAIERGELIFFEIKNNKIILND